MAAFALLLAASAVRAASLNLCSDEYLLLLARPNEVVSVTRLAQDPEESVLASQAQRVNGNRGRLEDVIDERPTVVLTMGGGGRSSGAIARKLRLQVVDLPQPASLVDVSANLRRVASALGDRHRADAFIERITRLKDTRPAQQREALWLGGGGLSLAPGSIGAQWLELAGLRQRSLPGGHATLETLITNPPAVLVTSNYRAGQMSQGQRWLKHPLLAHLPSRRLPTDGRRWTCAGPLMVGEVERLRRMAK
ncbi:MAG: ABC transporter substrate-binding protein [Sphingomicrobium sp.]|nr:hypothetical protein [Sphingomonadales bacterium]